MELYTAPPEGATVICADLCRHRNYAEGWALPVLIGVMTPWFLVVWLVLVSA